MTRYLLSGVAALAMSVAFAAPSLASPGGETEHGIIVARVNRGVCHALEKKLDALHTTDYTALKLRRKAITNCAETDDFSTYIGARQMRHALDVARADQAAAKKPS